jgi:hypothetical protein
MLTDEAGSFVDPARVADAFLDDHGYRRLLLRNGVRNTPHDQTPLHLRDVNLP